MQYVLRGSSFLVVFTLFGMRSFKLSSEIHFRLTPALRGSAGWLWWWSYSYKTKDGISITQRGSAAGYLLELELALENPEFLEIT